MQHELLGDIAVEGVDALLVGGGAERAHGEGLGLAAAEDGGAVGAGQHADLDLDGAYGLRVAPVDAQAFGHDAGAHDLLLEGRNHVAHCGKRFGLLGPGGIGSERLHDLVLDCLAGRLALHLVLNLHGLLEAAGFAELGNAGAQDRIVLAGREGHLFLAGLGAQGLLGLQQGHDLAAGPVEGVDDVVFGDEARLAFHHGQGGLAGSEDDVEVALPALAVGGVEDELAVDAPDAAADDGSVEGQARHVQGGRGAGHGEDVGIVFLIGGEHRGQHLDVLHEPLGEERTDGAVDEAGNQGFVLRGAADFATEEAAGDAPGGVHALRIFDGQGEEAPVDLKLDGADGDEHHGAAALHPHGAVGLVGNAAGFEDEVLAADAGGHPDGVEDVLEHGSPLPKGIPGKLGSRLPGLPGYPFTACLGVGKSARRGPARPLPVWNMQPTCAGRASQSARGSAGCLSA